MRIRMFLFSPGFTHQCIRVQQVYRQSFSLIFPLERAGYIAFPIDSESYLCQLSGQWPRKATADLHPTFTIVLFDYEIHLKKELMRFLTPLRIISKFFHQCLLSN